MPGLFDSTPKLLGSAPTLLHEATVPGVGMSHVITNKDHATLPVWVWLSRAGEPDTYLLAGFRLGSGDTYDTMGTKKVALQAGDKILGRCPRSGLVTSIVSAYRDTE